MLTAALVAGLVAGGAALYSGYGMGAQTPAPVEQATALKSVARGELRPDSEATVRTLVGGVVTQLPVSIGSNVVENQELARVRAPDGSISVVTAPWHGSVTNLPVHAGDTVMAGATIASVGDVSRLRIETDDVDEFMVARIRVGQPVTVTVDAIEGRELKGRVRSIALRSERDAEGDLHYPVIVDLDWTPPDVRSGMTVRVHIPTGVGQRLEGLGARGRLFPVLQALRLTPRLSQRTNFLTISGQMPPGTARERAYA